MVTKTKEYKEIINILKGLPYDKISMVKDFAQSLKLKSKNKKIKFADLSGCIIEEDAKKMIEEIEKACEKIDYNEW